MPSDDLVPNFPLCSLSTLAPQRQVQRVGDWFEQRKAYRLAALLALRRREGLPSPVDDQGNLLETRLDDFGNAAYYDQSGQKVFINMTSHEIIDEFEEKHIP